MIITCGDCGARFRLDTALLKGAKRAQVRCRKCGGRTVVRLHEESPVPVHPPQETIPPSTIEPSSPAQEPVSPRPVEPPAPAQEPPGVEADISGVVTSEPLPPPPEDKAVLPDNVSIEPEPEPSAPAQEPPAFEADFSGVVKSEPMPPPPEEKEVLPVNVRIEPEPEPEPAAPLAANGLTSSVPHTAPAEEPEPAQPGTAYSRVEDLFADPLPREEYPAGENPPEETAATESGRKAPSRRASFMLKVLVISVLWILLLAGGTYYFGTTKSGQDIVGKRFAGRAGRTGSAPERPVYDIRDVKWHIDKDSTAGNLFVVKGAVANVGNVPSTGIRIQATLLGKDNEVLAEKAAFAGNLIDETSLRQMDRPAIDGAMSNRFGEGDVNKEIPPGKALPFMVIFFDPPGKIGGLKVNAVDAN